MPDEKPLPACLGQHELFDSTEADDHEEARRLCRGCPMFTQCADLAVHVASTALNLGTMGTSGPEGTWAGRLWKGGALILGDLTLTVTPEHRCVDCDTVIDSRSQRCETHRRLHRRAVQKRSEEARRPDVHPCVCGCGRLTRATYAVACPNLPGRFRGKVA